MRLKISQVEIKDKQRSPNMQMIKYPPTSFLTDNRLLKDEYLMTLKNKNKPPVHTSEAKRKQTVKKTSFVYPSLKPRTIYTENFSLNVFF